MLRAAIYVPGELSWRSNSSVIRVGKKVPSMDDLSPRASREPSVLAAA